MSYLYPGDELDVFRHAIRWKRYYASILGPHIRGNVLEVGAGIGGTSRFLCSGAVRAWTCLEPDEQLAARLEESLAAEPLPVPARVVRGTVAEGVMPGRFDAILYIDVLEHIEDDRGELEQSARLLDAGGSLVVLSPAHQWLFSAFDRAVGHCRRYSRPALVALRPAGTHLVSAIYLDSVGMALSLANRLLLREARPTLAQIKFWDSTVIPISRGLDRLTGFHLGKTVVAVFQADASVAGGRSSAAC